MTQLPTPVDARVVKKEEKGGVFGAITFSGWPLDFEVSRLCSAKCSGNASLPYHWGKIGTGQHTLPCMEGTRWSSAWNHAPSLEAHCS